MAARMGNLSYRISKLLSAVFATAIIFSVPFLIEIVLNCLAFPLEAQGDLSQLHVYSPTYVGQIKKYLFSSLYQCSPYLYAVLGTLFFGVLSGLISGITVAFASVFKTKYRISLFFPAFLLLNASIYLSSLFSRGNFSIEWYHYFLLFDETEKRPTYIAIVVLLLFVISIVGTVWGGKRDCIQ